ncbi:hypothetical protein QWZ13_00710 [Reinekea marina]|nr:hypothetical protein [Reinekea marina]MDN3647424.1 hypothetical protein [Reinekea marina]
MHTQILLVDDYSSKALEGQHSRLGNKRRLYNFVFIMRQLLLVFRRLSLP